jgi:anti-sigma regulatory factor (Ser/Thr protein kinase)
MSLSARPENVAIVRHALAGLAESLGMDETALADLKTIVTEACTNVVVHAYDGRPGPLEVEASANGNGLEVVVRDHGAGIRPRPIGDETSLRLGLPLIAALASSFELRGGNAGGTEVIMRMEFEHPEGRQEWTARTQESEERNTVISMEAGQIVAPVVSRVMAILAARADLSVDRLSDAVLLGDAISAHPSHVFARGRISLALEEADGRIGLEIGPLVAGGGERMLQAMAIPGLSASLQVLADDVKVEDRTDGQYLLLRIAERSYGSPA